MAIIPQQAAFNGANVSTSIWDRVKTTISWPFTNRFASPLWLGLRLYLAWIWLQFGWGKINAGWLTSDPMGTSMKHIAEGRLQVPFEFFRSFCAALLDAGLSPLLSHSMPFLELAVALSFLTGVLVIPAAIGAILLLASFILGGIGTLAFDGRMIVMHLVMLPAYRIAGAIGFEPLLKRILRALLLAQPTRLPRIDITR